MLIEEMMVEVQQATEKVFEREILCLQEIFHAASKIFNNDPIVASKKITNTNTKYMHEAMKHPNKSQLVKYMQ